MSEYLSEATWKKGIEESNTFMILGTDEYFKKVSLFEQALYAVKLNKIFIVALKKGVKIPKAYPIPKDATIFEWYDQASLNEGTLKVFKDLKDNFKDE